MNKEDLVELGTCNRPHGIKGGFQFFLHNPEDSILSKNSKIIIHPKSGASSVLKDGETHKIKSIQFGNKTICYLDGISDRNIVEAMVPFTISYPRSEFPELMEDEFYLNDLLGLKVLSNLSGDELGKVQDFYDNGAQTVLKIKLAKETIELPLIDNFFPEINIEEGFITMVTPEVTE